jgi:hypothetical protein
VHKVLAYGVRVQVVWDARAPDLRGLRHLLPRLGRIEDRLIDGPQFGPP